MVDWNSRTWSAGRMRGASFGRVCVALCVMGFVAALRTGSVQSWYHATYIKTGSFVPLVHAMGVVFGTGYYLEKDHLEHKAADAQRAFWTAELAKEAPAH